MTLFWGHWRFSIDDLRGGSKLFYLNAPLLHGNESFHGDSREVSFIPNGGSIIWASQKFSNFPA